MFVIVGGFSIDARDRMEATQAKKAELRKHSTEKTSKTTENQKLTNITNDTKPSKPEQVKTEDDVMETSDDVSSRKTSDDVTRRDESDDVILGDTSDDVILKKTCDDVSHEENSDKVMLKNVTADSVEDGDTKAIDCDRIPSRFNGSANADNKTAIKASSNINVKVKKEQIMDTVVKEEAHSSTCNDKKSNTKDGKKKRKLKASTLSDKEIRRLTRIKKTRRKRHKKGSKSHLLINAHVLMCFNCPFVSFLWIHKTIVPTPFSNSF